MRCNRMKKVKLERPPCVRYFVKGRNIEGCPPGNGNHKKKSLQAEKTNESPSYSFLTGTRRVFLWISGKSRSWKRCGSLTVEAAAAIPVFLLTVSSILGILDSYRVQAIVKTSLHQSALELGMYAYADSREEDSPVGAVSSALCAGYAKSKLPDLGRNVKVSTTGSSYRDGKICLTARMEYQLPLTLVPLPPVRLVNESRVDGWTGQNRGEKAEQQRYQELVYVSEYESVYHTSGECTHIDLAIYQNSRKEAEELRNVYGKKYHCCEKCGSGSGNSTVYYTEKGDRYHASPDCSGLKRTIRLVAKSEVRGLHQCERCKAKEEA